ncbi:MAG TPA: MoxR family ATPase [Candidatus Acidoferrales bacterium]|nr:MoxR family ATPase [Candidatus Acidoferrales bacterium]
MSEGAQPSATSRPTIEWLGRLRAQFSSVIVGQTQLLRRLLQALITGNHVLIEGVPGLGKTLSILTIARCLDATFHRIQFTPDLLPSDIIGTLIYDARTGQFTPRKGPVFANIVLADEVNRAPAKVQSALLEAMQERQVTIGDHSFQLPAPFLVLATQNPIEQEGTYPLPEAQLDRFLFKLVLDYPEIAEERLILDRMVRAVPVLDNIRPVASTANILLSRNQLDQVHLDDSLRDYIVNLVDATRHPSRYGLKLDPLIRYGASPRASIFLALAAKGEALLSGRGYTTPQDVKEVALDVLRHRVLLTYEADAEGVTPEKVIRQVLGAVKVP